MKSVIKVCVAMVCVTVIAVVALVLGYDGVVEATGMAAVAGLGGFIVGKKVE